MIPENMMGSRSRLGDCRDRFGGLGRAEPVFLRLRLGDVFLLPLLHAYVFGLVFSSALTRLVLRCAGAGFAPRTGMRRAIAVSFALMTGSLRFASDSEHS